MYVDEMTMCWVLYDGMIYLFMIMKNALAREPIHSLPGRYASVSMFAYVYAYCDLSVVCRFDSELRYSVIIE